MQFLANAGSGSVVDGVLPLVGGYLGRCTVQPAGHHCQVGVLAAQRWSCDCLVCARLHLRPSVHHRHVRTTTHRSALRTILPYFYGHFITIWPRKWGIYQQHLAVSSTTGYGHDTAVCLSVRLFVPDNVYCSFVGLTLRAIMRFPCLRAK